MKRSLIAISVGIALSFTATADIMTTEYVEGSGFNKAIEIITPEAINTTIMALQGDGLSSPFTVSDNKSEDDYQITGVVTAIQTAALDDDLPIGFFLQDLNGDADESTSDGIFVQGDITGINLGNTVTVQGKVYEDSGWTTLTDTYISNIENTAITIAATPLRTLSTDIDFDFTLERHEGMLIELDEAADMHVTRTFSFDFSVFRSNMVVAHERINVTPNQQYVPGSAEAAVQEKENEAKRLFIESFEEAANGVVPWYDDFLTESTTSMDDGSTTSDNYIRIDDTLNGLQGIVGYSSDEYRLYVTNQATKETFIHNNDRALSPELPNGELRIATFNVLNYFNSPFGGDANPTNSNRGAETEEEFARQGDKIAKAIIAMDADIVGLMEIENNGFGKNSAIAHLVEKINTLLTDPEDHYSYISSDQNDDFIGTDAIANQVIYKASKVTLETYRLIEMPEQHATEGEDPDNFQRDAITPTFNLNDTDQSITISVNHFKSKGSTCWEDVNLQNEDDIDGQGSCENLRVSAAQHIGTELAKIAGHKFILGDLNSYASEDPVLLLTELPEDYIVTPARDTFIGTEVMDGAAPESLSTSFGYKNVIKDLHPDAYSYSFNDSVGSLDYILVDADTAANNVVAAIDWNINASESPLVDYTIEDSGDLAKTNDLYRASDHDPAIIVLTFSEGTEVVNPDPIDPIDPTTPVDPIDPVTPTDPVENESASNGSSGGSMGTGGLLLLGFLGFLRRKILK